MTDKDDEIQELKQQRDLLLQENAELRERQKWIPVTESLPKDHTPVVVYIPSEAQEDKVQIAFAGYTHWIGSYGRFPEDAITHWMPLPPKPEVRE